MTVDPEFAELFSYTPQETAALEERAALELYRAKRTRWAYRQDLQQALKDHEREARPVFKSQPVPTHNDVVASLIGGPVLAAGALSLFFLMLWVVQQAFK